MTENEAIKILKKPTEHIRIYDDDFVFSSDFAKAYEIAIKALEENQQYEAIGTVEELQEVKMQYDNIHSIAEKTALMGLSDFASAKEAVETEIKRSLDYSLKEYQKIGTVEEFKALKEKNEPKKVVYVSNIEIKTPHCPNCNIELTMSMHLKKFCNCGQKLNWQ